jgi:hypothetical protein
MYGYSALSSTESGTGHHARLGTRLMAMLYRGGHPRPPNFMRFPRRNAPDSGRESKAPLTGKDDPGCSLTRVLVSSSPLCACRVHRSLRSRG